MLATEAPFPQYADIDGKPLDSGYLYFGVAGLNPETDPVTVYWDAAGTQPAAQPIRTINGYAVRSGTPALVYANGDYSQTIRNERGELLYYGASAAEIANGLIVSQQVTALQTALAAAGGSAMVGFQQSGAGAVLRTLQAKGREIVSLTDFGASPDGATTNQQATFALALAAVAVGGVIELTAGTYVWSASTQVTKKVTVRGRGATIKFDPAFNVGSGTLEAFSVSGDDILFEGIDFDATGAPAPSNNSRFIWSTAARTTVRGCRAKNLPGGTANVQVAFGSANTSSDFSVLFCYFESCPGAAFSQGPRPVFAYNRCVEPKDVSFALNSTNCVGGQILGNNIRNAASNVSGHILAEEGASDWLFEGNYVYGVRNGIGIGAVSPSIVTVVEGGQIVDNTIDGGGLTATNASALISVSVYYRNTQINSNKLRGMPAGLSANAAVVAPLLGTVLRDNRIDCSAGTGSAAAIVLNPAGGECELIDNEINCVTGPARHVLVNSGSNGGNKLILRGGRYLGASEGVNFNLNAPTNIGLLVENITEITSSAPFSVSAAYPAFGDRQTFFNTYGAAQWPHSIKAKTVMYGNGAPAAGTWGTGDEVINVAPTASGVDRWRCVSGGSPGVWKAGAALAA